MAKNLLLSLLTIGLSVVYGTAIPGGLLARDALPDGYRAVPLHWSGAIEQDGNVLSFNGTIQEIEAEIQESRPGFSWKTAFEQRMDNSELSNLQSRDKEDKFFCDIGGDGEASTLSIGVGSMALGYAGGSCGIGPGPYVCARLSCAYDGGIWLCNDNAWGISPSCGYLATYADDILGKCGPVKVFGGVQGQEFDSDNYNVAVGHAKCT
ncbi:hypothetical protein F4775DRAFT_587522 [Biscogniauxia sp. FL1348]|nr:hypothetical protein F4775DRAFT_587522 [Biscogniauxia sp. FL1348]